MSNVWHTIRDAWQQRSTWQQHDSIDSARDRVCNVTGASLGSYLHFCKQLSACCQGGARSSTCHVEVIGVERSQLSQPLCHAVQRMPCNVLQSMCACRGSCLKPLLTQALPNDRASRWFSGYSTLSILSAKTSLQVAQHKDRHKTTLLAVSRGTVGHQMLLEGTR
jgi:hypothetical protein